MHPLNSTVIIIFFKKILSFTKLKYNNIQRRTLTRLTDKSESVQQRVGIEWWILHYFFIHPSHTAETRYRTICFRHTLLFSQHPLKNPSSAIDTMRKIILVQAQVRDLLPGLENLLHHRNEILYTSDHCFFSSITSIFLFEMICLRFIELDWIIQNPTVSIICSAI